MAQSQWVSSCCNPFGQPRHSSKRKNLRPVLAWMCEKMSSLNIGAKICDDCRKKLAQLPTKVSESEELPESSEEDGASSYSEHAGASGCSEKTVHSPLQSMNQCLSVIGETPIVKTKLNQAKYPKEKLKKISMAMKKQLLPGRDSSDSDESEMLTQLKDKFRATTDKSEKVMVLTVLPRSWTLRKVQEEFGASNYMVRKAKALVKEKGILSTPNPKPGHVLPAETTDLVRNFYECDEVSRMMPGRKDYVSVKQADERVQVQKRLVLSNLKEVYQVFKEKYPDKPIGFSKFADLRPKHCILAGASGTHAVCVCTIHQNVKLMMMGGKIAGLTADDSIPLTTYDTCLAQIICNPPQPQCYLNTCSFCPGISHLKDRLRALMDDNLVDSIIYKQWVSVDRCTLETFCKSADDFVDVFCEKLEVLLPHSFIAKQQSSFQTKLKSDLLPGELLVSADFV